MDDFIAAVKAGDLSRVHAMLVADPRLLTSTENGLSVILLALYHGQRDVARALIERGAPVSFHDACAAGENDRAKKLLADDPSLLDRRSTDGFPPLGLAIFFGNRELARDLVEKGADVNANAENAQRVAPIHAAAAVCDHEMLRLLLSRGANPNARQQSDYTPLHTAASRGDIEMAEILLGHGADAAVRGSDGMSVADVARKYGREEFVLWWETEKSIFTTERQRTQRKIEGR